MSLDEALHKEAPDLVDLLVPSREEFRRLVIESARLHEGEKLTVATWLGSYFELAAPNMPTVRWMLEGLASDYADLVNKLVRDPLRRTSRTKRTRFLNGRLNEVDVTSEFTKAIEVTDVRIRRRNSTGPGVKYVDRISMRANAEDQRLGATVEKKTRGASGGLRKQVAARDRRLSDVKGDPNMEITYLRDGKRESMPLEKLILVEGDLSPYNRIGLRAGVDFDWKVAEDADGNPYLRVTIPCKTDVVRKILQRVHRDPSWR
jgi:hypothetical protein